MGNVKKLNGLSIFLNLPQYFCDLTFQSRHNISVELELGV